MQVCEVPFLLQSAAVLRHIIVVDRSRNNAMTQQISRTRGRLDRRCVSMRYRPGIRVGRATALKCRLATLEQGARTLTLLMPAEAQPQTAPPFRTDTCCPTHRRWRTALSRLRNAERFLRRNSGLFLFNSGFRWKS